MIVSGKNSGGYKVDLQAGAHALQSDRSVADGGDDAGPTPHELLLGSLAACKVITVQMYAQRKGWPLAGVNISLAYKRVNGERIVEQFDGEIGFVGDLTDEQRQRLLEIAAKCPVHAVLVNQVEINIALMAA